MYKKTIVHFARFTKYYHERKIKESDKGGTRSVIGGMRNACKVLVTKTEEKRKAGRPVHGSKANNKTCLK